MKMFPAGPGQMSLFDTSPSTPEIIIPDDHLDDIVLEHKEKFRIGKTYLLDLSKYNNYLKTPPTGDTTYDNLLLRNVFGGIQNSRETPPEIFEGLNALEICLMEAGIFKRKYVYYGDMVIQPKGTPSRKPIVTHRSPESYAKQSRIKVDGYLDWKSLYEVMLHLLTATGVNKINSRYKKEWQEAFQSDAPSKEQKRFKKANSYDSSTLKRRMDYIERTFPDAVKKFKEVLTQPFIPPRIVIPGKFGNPGRVINDEGYSRPGRTYKRGVKGRSFHRLNEYADRIIIYFQQKQKLTS